MTTLLWLAGRTFGRHPIRTALVVVGLSVTGALLLDMMMLAGGLQASLGQVLSQMGFAVRVVPKGTTPFSGIAEIPDGDRLAAAIGEQPGVAAALPIAATNLYVWRQAAPFASFAFGVPRGETGAYVIVDGHDLSRQGSGDPPVVVSRTLARFDGVRVGDTLTAATAAGAVLEGTGTPERFQVVGIADFYLDLASQRSMVMRTADLRRLQGRPQGAAAEILVRMADPDQVAALLSWLGTRHPEVDALSTERYLSRIGARLTYFNQFALILSTLSLAISFLLITAMVTLSLGERLGEIAMLRALGFTRGRIGILILMEGLLLSAGSVLGAFVLGLTLSGYLDTILRATPGIPEKLHFFTLTASALGRTIALLLVTGAAGGLYPAAIASRLPVALTLHAEVLS
ncbi:MAG TPA: FtsX-like permease family protein [bacterium]|nr:FtsX-like permease family protein [bacterium]